MTHRPLAQPLSLRRRIASSVRWWLHPGLHVTARMMTPSLAASAHAPRPSR